MKFARASAVISLLSIFLFPLHLENAHATAPTTGTAVAWTNDTYFDMYSSQSGVLSSDQANTSSLVWQVFFANAPLTIPADGVNRYGWQAYGNGSNAVNYRIAISSVDNTLGSFAADTQISSAATTSYSAGVFKEQVGTASVTIPAKRYFLIGIVGGPFTRTIKSLAANRTAQVGGVNYVTALNTVYFASHASSITTGIPSAIGGNVSGFSTLNGYASVMSIKFKATGAPPLPALSTPETPTVNSVDGSYVVISNPSIVSNAQSYIANLYAANGTTFIESRTVTNLQVTSGYTWTGLSTQTTYQIGLTAVGDGVNYSNSLSSSLRAFTTTLNTTSVRLEFSSVSATFNSTTIITATLGGSTSGRITFFSNGKRIPGCISRLVTSSSLTCNWKPANRGVSIVTATFTPTGASYLGSNAMRSILISNRTLSR